MNKIGIIGGIGPASTIAYYHLLIDLFKQRLKTKHYPEILIYSIDMTKMLHYVFEDKQAELVAFLKNKVEILAQSDINYIALASNTPHIVFDQLAAVVDVKLISIVEETCRLIAQTNKKKVGLLGTKPTMSKGFYQKVGTLHGIEIVTPDEQHQNYVHEKYMSELVFNQINAITKQELIQIVRHLQKSNQIEGLILGGTELPLILEQKDFEDLVVFNTTEIHVNAILDRIIR